MESEPFEVFRNRFCEADRRITLKQFQALIDHELEDLISNAKFTLAEAEQSRLFHRASNNPLTGKPSFVNVNYSIDAFPPELLLTGDFLGTEVRPVPMCGYPRYQSHFDMDMTSFDAFITPSIINWMYGCIGDGENGQIYRNDSLFNVYHRLASMTGFNRNRREDSTVIATRFYRSDMYEGVPVVIVEERLDSLREALDGLKTKAVWLPHHERLPFIFSIAVTTQQLAIYAISKDLTFQLLFSADLTDIVQRWHCVVAVINIARTLKCFIKQDLTMTSALRFNTWYQRSNKRIRLEASFVEVEYSSDDVYDRMMAFYQVTSKVKHLEHLHSKQADSSERRICLVPVGVARRPSSSAELRVCIKQILECLMSLHMTGYVHCDVKWSNIINANNDWYLIDCEHAVGLNYTDLLASRSTFIRERYVMDRSKPWSVLYDLYQVGILLLDSTFTEEVSKLIKLRDVLLSKRFTIQAVKKLLSKL